MRVPTLAALGGLMIWSLAGPSLAGTLTLDFGLSGDVDSPIGRSVPGSATGTARVVLTGVDALGLVTDPSATATLQDLSVQASLGVIVGVFQFSQLAPVTGIFDGTTLGIPAGALTLMGVAPFGGSGTFTNQAAVAVLLTSLGDAAQVMLSGAVGTASTGMVTFDLVGRQVARNFSAPEPPEMCILMLGLGTLAAGTAGARRRSSESSRRR